MLQLTKNTKHLGQNLRRLSTPILTILFAMLLTVVAWGQDLDKGTYTITNNVSHDNPVGEGMARSYTETVSDVEVNDSGTFVTLAFNNTHYMGDFTISVGGSKVTCETTALAGNIKKLKFKVPSLSTSIKVGLYVEPMNTTVEYTVTLNESSLKLIKKAEPVAEPVKESAAEVVQNSSSASNSNASSTTSSVSSSASNAANNMTSSTTNNSSAVANKTNTTSSSSKQEQTQAVSQKAQDTTSSETAKKSETTVQKGEKTSQEEVVTENITNDAKVQSQEVADANDANIEKTDEASAQVEENFEEHNQDEKQAEVQGEVQEETEQDGAKTENIEETENVDAVTSASKNTMKNMMLIIGVIVVAGAIGSVIYLKRK